MLLKVVYRIQRNSFFIERSKECRMKFYVVKDGEFIALSKNYRNERALIIQHEYQHLIGKTIATEGEEF